MGKYIIIPKLKAEPYKKLLLAWHTGIDPVEIKNGDFVLNETALKLLDNYPTKTVTVADKEVIVKTELSKLILVDEKDIVFKTYELT